MKLDFLAFGGGPIPAGPSGGQSGQGAGEPEPNPRRTRLRMPRGLIHRYMRQRLDVAPLDDASRTVRTGAIAAALFFGVFILFALVAPISGAAMAPGQVATSGNKMLIQPSGTGIVSEILVQEGQEVRAGQPLVRLNGVRSGAQLKQAQARRDALRALEARLIAERDGHERLAFPPDLVLRSNDPAAVEAMRAQMVLFERHRSVLEADRSVTDSRLGAATARRTAAQRQLALINDELEGVEALYRRGFARKTTLRALQRTAAQLEADIATGTAAVEEAQTNQRRTRDAQLMEIVSQLTQVQQELAQVNPQLDVSRYQADQDLLRAPVDGRVSGVAQIGPGTVVNGGRTLMEVVPSQGSLIVEARVRPEDIDDVTVGSEATVRLTTVTPHGQTAFAGRVVTLSPTRIEDGNGGGYYRAQVVVNDPAELERAGVTLQPGLPASVHITTQRRTLWDYLVSPFSDAMSRTFREE